MAKLSSQSSGQGRRSAPTIISTLNLRAYIFATEYNAALSTGGRAEKSVIWITQAVFSRGSNRVSASCVPSTRALNFSD
jgi:hypothetical protein